MTELGRRLLRPELSLRRWMPFAVTFAVPLLTLVVVVVNGGGPQDVAVAAAVGAAAGGLVESQRRGQEEKEDQLPAAASGGVVEEWRGELRRRVVNSRVRDQLAKMTGSSGALPRAVMPVLAFSTTGIVIDEVRRPWSAIREKWDSSSGRLIVLGDPGYGKTVAALTLLDHINGSEVTGRPVAELFSLADWYRWQAQNPDGGVAAWLPHALRLAYPRFLPLEVAQALIDRELILPLFDGLDEIPSIKARRRCIEAIQEYAGSRRPFVVTCRLAEYSQLTRHFPSTTPQVVLAGLDSSEVAQALEKHSSTLSGAAAAIWREVGSAYNAGNATLRALFESPLRLIAALQAYSQTRDEESDLFAGDLQIKDQRTPLTYDPRELLSLDVQAAGRQIWDRLLLTNALGFHGADEIQVRQWLTSIGRAIKTVGRQRFMLHELYLVVPERAKSERRYVGGLSLLIATPFGVSAGLLASSPTVGVSVACAIAVGVAVFARIVPNVSGVLTWQARYQLARRTAPLSLLAGAPAGLVIGWTAGWLIGVLTALAFALSAIMIQTLREGTRAIGESGPPREFAGRELGAILAASRSRGRFVGIAAGAFYGVSGGLVTGVTSGLPLQLSMGVGILLSGFLVGEFGLGIVGGIAAAFAVSRLSGVVFGVYAATAVTLAAALRGGLSPCLYHYWARLLMMRPVSERVFEPADSGADPPYGVLVLPMRLVEFMHWCAHRDRGWLRVSDACEFRHRELLDYLVPDPPEPRQSRGETS